MAKEFYNESEIQFVEHLKDPRFKDLTDQFFGRFKVLGFAGKNKSGHSIWFCRCECKNITKVEVSNLINRHTTSCGCLMKERVRETQTKHGHNIGRRPSGTYTTWRNLLSRCQNLKDKRFNNYGKRGIKVCERWLKFENFLEDMGEKPKGLSLDRIENDKGYYKENCRWATPKEQSNNRRNNHILTFDGKIQNLGQFANEFGIKRATLGARIDRGWTIEKALTTPVKSMKTKTVNKP